MARDPHTATAEAVDGSTGHGPAATAAYLPGSGGIAHGTPGDLPGASGRLARVSRRSLALAAFVSVLLVAWLAVDPRTPDLAAQAYRVALFGHLGFAVWDAHWYAGHALPGYSLLYPPLASLLGMRLLGVLCVLSSTFLFAQLARAAFGRAGLWGAAWFAVAAMGDVWIGRLTFALGVTLALAAAVAVVRKHWPAAAVLAALCAAASPVAGALLGLAALSVALAQRSPRVVITLAVPAAVVVLALALLFPEGGYEPYPLASFVATALVVGAFLWAIPPTARLLRIGAYVYLLACLACLAIHSPIGSNIERYAVLLAGPLLLCALLVDSEPEPGAATRRVRTPAAVAALLVIGVWVAWGPVRETLAVARGGDTSASYYAPVERFLARTGGAPVRIEVPLTRSHWEAAELAPTVSLARGWEKQLETRYDGVLLASGLGAASYDRWLHAQAVTYVALPDAPLDPSSAQEGTLIRHGLPYLHEVFASAHWRVFAVLAPTPLVSGPARLTSLGHDSFALRASSPGRLVVRVHFTRFWSIAQGAGCVTQAPGGWTAVDVRAPGTVVVDARFSLARVFASGGSCTR